ncbi:MAG TPA: serine hydrolase domain-containing protein [Chitinophagaceae bacterium]|nr:serine hydrolase domain-containing protein [Chitinophagaceae bacterium]
MSHKTLFTALLILSLIAKGYTQSLDRGKLDQLLNLLSEKDKAMGTLLINKEGNALYSRSIGYGYINGTGKKPLTMSARYRIGSVTKMFTATMVYQLVEEGKLNLTDHLDKFYPQIPNASEITIEQILAHRSGIPGAGMEQHFASKRFTGVTKDEILEAIAQGRPEFGPGEKYSYSNAGYFILGNIIEKAGRQPYNKALQQRISSKIGLKDTYAATADIDVNKNECFSFKYYTDWKQEPVTHHSFLFGSGFIISTVADQAKFIEALFGGKLISQQSLDQMIRLQSGMDSFTYNGKTFYGHTGGVDGFGSWLAYQPEEKLTLAYATNGKVYPVGKIIDHIFDIYYNKPLDIPSFESLEISTETLDKYVGVYAIAEAPVKFTVKRDGNKLLIEMSGRPAFAVEPITEDKFKTDSPPMEFHFDVIKKQMTIKRGGGEKVFTKEN